MLILRLNGKVYLVLLGVGAFELDRKRSPSAGQTINHLQAVHAEPFFKMGDQLIEAPGVRRVVKVPDGVDVVQILDESVGQNAFDQHTRLLDLHK